MTPRRWAIPVLIAVVVVAWISPPAKAQGSATMYFRSPVAAVVDGQIAPGEYSGSFLDPTTGIELFLVHDGRNMTVGLVSPGTGWVAVGFGPPGVLMDGANILIGYVSGPTTVLSDEFGVGFEHFADTTAGGTDNLLERAGTEAGGRTTLEFRFPLDTGDVRDVRLLEGQDYGMIVAYQSTADDLVTLHTSAAPVSLTVERDPNALPTRVATLRLGSSGGEVEGDNVTLVATLLGDDGAPLSDSPLSFYLNSSVGPGPLGTVETDVYGVAAVNYTFRSPGEFTFFVRFTGDSDYLPARANLTVVAQPAGGQASFFTTDLAIRFVVGAVLGGVALAYGYSILQILQIRRLGSRAKRAPGRGDRTEDGTPTRGGMSK